MAGAAVATVSAQLVVMLVMMVGVFRSKKEENVLKGIRLFEPFSKEELGNICKIGGPTAIQGMVYCMISMVLTRMVAAFGAEAIATQRVGGQIESVSWNTADGFAAALNAFVGQNYGAKKNGPCAGGLSDLLLDGSYLGSFDHAGIYYFSGADSRSIFP